MLGNLLKTARQQCHLSEEARMAFCFCIKLSLFQMLLYGSMGVEGEIERGWFISKRIW